MKVSRRNDTSSSSEEKVTVMMRASRMASPLNLGSCRCVVDGLGLAWRELGVHSALSNLRTLARSQPIIARCLPVSIV